MVGLDEFWWKNKHENLYRNDSAPTRCFLFGISFFGLFLFQFFFSSKVLKFRSFNTTDHFDCKVFFFRVEFHEKKNNHFLNNFHLESRFLVHCCCCCSYILLHLYALPVSFSSWECYVWLCSKVKHITHNSYRIEKRKEEAKNKNKYKNWIYYI